MAATAVLVVGDSGSGKSTSIETLPNTETFIVNVASDKPLPFKGWKSKYTEMTRNNPNGNMLCSDVADTIIKTIQHVSDNRPEIRYIVIDDSQYVAANEFMRRSKEIGFQKFTDIGLNMYKLGTISRSLRSDLIVFYLSHAEETTDSGGARKSKAKTIGKLVDDKITYEGLFSIVLFTYKEEVKNGIEYGFITNGDATSTAKSPKGMFESAKIPNDLMLVANGIRAYED